MPLKKTTTTTRLLTGAGNSSAIYGAIDIDTTSKQSVLIKMLLISVLRGQLLSFFMREMRDRNVNKFNDSKDDPRAAYRRELLATLDVVKSFPGLSQFDDMVGEEKNLALLNNQFNDIIQTVCIEPYKMTAFSDSRFYERYLKNFGGFSDDNNQKGVLRNSCNFDPSIMISPFAELYSQIMGELPGKITSLESGEPAAQNNNQKINLLINLLGDIPTRFEYTNIRGNKRGWLSANKLAETENKLRSFEFSDKKLLLGAGETIKAKLLRPLDSDQAIAIRLAGEIDESFSRDKKAQFSVSRFKKVSRYIKANPKKSILFGVGAVIGAAGSVLLLSNPFGWTALAATAGLGLAAQAGISIGVALGSGLLGLASAGLKQIGRGKRKLSRKLGRIKTIVQVKTYQYQPLRNSFENIMRPTSVSKPRESLELDVSSITNGLKSVKKLLNKNDHGSALKTFILVLTELLDESKFSIKEQKELAFSESHERKMFIEHIADLQAKFIGLENFDTSLGVIDKTGMAESIYNQSADDSIQQQINQKVGQFNLLKAQMQPGGGSAPHRATAMESFRLLVSSNDLFKVLFNFKSNAAQESATTALQALSGALAKLKDMISKSELLAKKLYSFDPNASSSTQREGATPSGKKIVILSKDPTFSQSDLALNKGISKKIKSLWGMVCFQNSDLAKMKGCYEQLIKIILKKNNSKDCLFANAGLEGYCDKEFSLLDVLVRAERRLFKFDATVKADVEVSFSTAKQSYTDILCQHFELNHTFPATYKTSESALDHINSQVVNDLKNKGFQKAIKNHQTIAFFGMQFTPLQIIHYTKTVIDRRWKGDSDDLVYTLLNDKNPVVNSMLFAADSGNPTSSSRKASASLANT